MTRNEGPFHLYLEDAAEPIVGRVSRSANQNATPRIYGNKQLAQFFQAKYKPGDLVPIDILTPTSMRLGGVGAT